MRSDKKPLSNDWQKEVWDHYDDIRLRHGVSEVREERANLGEKFKFLSVELDAELQKAHTYILDLYEKTETPVREYESLFLWIKNHAYIHYQENPQDKPKLYHLSTKNDQSVYDLFTRRVEKLGRDKSIASTRCRILDEYLKEVSLSNVAPRFKPVKKQVLQYKDAIVDVLCGLDAAKLIGARKGEILKAVAEQLSNNINDFKSFDTVRQYISRRHESFGLSSTEYAVSELWERARVWKEQGCQ